MASALPREVLPKVFAFVPRDLQCLSALRVTSRDAKESVDARWCEARYWTECLVKDIIDFVPDDLQCLSSLRVASQNSKGCVEARWWKKQVRCMKDFVDQHEHLFADDPEMDEVDEQQEDFARNILLWVQPFLVNQPWRIEGPAQPTGDSATDEVTPQAAHMNLRRALVDLSERHNDVLRDILQQARHIERYHHRHTDTLHTMVSHTDRRHMEGPNESLFANLETSEIRSEDAPSASNVHTEMTREGIPREEVMNLLRRRGINEDLVQALLGDFEQSGYVAQGPIDHRSEISEPEGGGQLATLLDDDKHSGHKKRLGKYLACLLLVGIMNILMSIVFLLTLPTPFTGNADTIALQMEGNDKEATTAAAETPLYLAAQKGDANMVDALPEEILEASRKALLPTSGDRPEELPQDGPNAVLPPPAAKHRKLFLARRNASVPPKPDQPEAMPSKEDGEEEIPDQCPNGEASTSSASPMDQPEGSGLWALLCLDDGALGALKKRVEVFQGKEVFQGIPCAGGHLY
ncbi:unnamed protein product [Durusdinium trenchii]|uniref:F-box domain-containing protein n=1 Tax=Durusdinium trenchii TaxID=1381693 RepID=A0ABP0N770_9DINO